MTIANAISLGRLFSAPVALWLILSGHDRWALWLFAAAGLSDAVDGYVARRWGPASTIGAYLDPIADKALLVAAYVALGHRDALPLWLVIMIVSRDTLIVGGAILVHTVTGRLSMRPLPVSKLNTVMQIVLAALVLTGLGLGWRVGPWVEALIWVVAATTLASGAAYVVAWGRRFGRDEDT